MQDFGTKADNAPPPSGQLSAAEFNNLAVELENSVLRSGQALDGASVLQIAKSLFIHATKSQGFQDSGAANAYVATPISGSSGTLLPTTYAELPGAKITFIASASNTGNSTLNIGQTTGTLLGSKKILTRSGAEVPSGRILTGDTVMVQYDSSLDSGSGAWRIVGGGADFVSFLPKRTFASKDFVRIPDVPGGLIIQWGTITNAASASKLETLATTYPAANLAVVLTGLQGTGNQQAYTVLNSVAAGSFNWSGFFASGGSAPVLSGTVGQVQGYFISVGY